MTTMLASTMLGVFMIYLIYMEILFGRLHSISESWDKLRKLKRGKGFIFTFFCWLLAGHIIAYGGHSGSDWGILYVVSGIGLIFTGVAAAFRPKSKRTGLIHNIGSVVGIVAALLALGIADDVWFPLLAASVASAIITIVGGYLIKNPIYWIEVSCFLAIDIGLYCLR